MRQSVHSEAMRVKTRHTCDICGRWLKSLGFIHPGDKWFKTWHSTTPSRINWARSNTWASFFASLWSLDSIWHRISHSTHCFQSSMAILIQCSIVDTSRTIAATAICVRQSRISSGCRLLIKLRSITVIIGHKTQNAQNGTNNVN